MHTLWRHREHEEPVYPFCTACTMPSTNIRVKIVVFCYSFCHVFHYVFLLPVISLVHYTYGVLLEFHYPHWGLWASCLCRIHINHGLHAKQETLVTINCECSLPTLEKISCDGHLLETLFHMLLTRLMSRHSAKCYSPANVSFWVCRCKKRRMSHRYELMSLCWLPVTI